MRRTFMGAALLALPVTTLFVGVQPVAAGSGVAEASAVAPSAGRPGGRPGHQPGSRHHRGTVVSAEWAGDDDSQAPANTLVDGFISIDGDAPAGLLIRVTLQRGTFTAIPDKCAASSTVTKRSFIAMDGTRLVCRLARATRQPKTRVKFTALVTGAVGEHLSGEAYSPAGDAPLTSRQIVPGQADTDRTLRLLSSPDFLNADVGDLRKGPNFWTPGRTENSINDAYRRALSTVMSDWVSQRPDGVLVAGDLVDGWWGSDRGGSGNFGPVDTAAHRRKALKRAADTYYPQWKARFTNHHLPVYPAMGDHEFGDDPWDAEKRALAPQFESSYTKYMTRHANGSARFTNRPRGSRHEFSAYAWRPAPNVQMITLNEFDVTDARMRIRLDRVQMQWLVRVLKDARRDGVQWVVAQGHVPIVGPVRKRGSSGLFYEGGENSRLWKVFQRYGLDMYLCGEVHDVTAVQRDGIVQISHGGLFQFGLTNYVLADFFDDHITLTSRDYEVHHRDAADGSRLWETRPAGIPKVIRVNPTPFTIGTATLYDDGTFDPSGILNPYRARVQQ